jgi:hypothetical protein
MRIERVIGTEGEVQVSLGTLRFVRRDQARGIRQVDIRDEKEYRREWSHDDRRLQGNVCRCRIRHVWLRNQSAATETPV